MLMYVSSPHWEQFGRDASAQDSKHFNNTVHDSNTIIAVILEFVHDFG